MKMLKEQYKRIIVLYNMVLVDCKRMDIFYYYCKKNYVKGVIQLNEFYQIFLVLYFIIIEDGLW